MSDTNPIYRYTIEEHGDAHALYWGRNQQRHGYNLCRISDLSHNCDLVILEKTLNEGIEAEGLRKRIAELEASLRKIIDEGDDLAGDPMKWSVTISKLALGWSFIDGQAFPPTK